MRYYFLENVSNEVHIPHCLEYLYDSIICAADTTLEPVDDKGVADGIGVQHKCNNFGNVLAWAKANGDKYNYLIEARRPN